MLPVLKRNRLARIGWDVFDAGREFDRLLGSTFGAPSSSAWTPAIDVRETKNEFLVSAELPESAPEHGFECPCGYRIPEAAAVMEIPEWLAREKHERLGVEW